MLESTSSFGRAFSMGNERTFGQFRTDRASCDRDHPKPFLVFVFEIEFTFQSFQIYSHKKKTETEITF